MPSILYVEDNYDNRFIVRKFLEHMGYEYIEAFTARQGISLANTQLPDLILMDIHLPDMSGLDAIEQVRANPQLQHIPIVALTADIHTRQECLDAGCNAYLNKPISYGQMLRTIAQMLPLPA